MNIKSEPKPKEQYFIVSTAHIGLCKIIPKISAHVFDPQIHLYYDIEKVPLGKVFTNYSLWQQITFQGQAFQTLHFSF